MKSDLVYLKHIRDAILKIEKYTACDEASFLATDYLQDAVIRALEVIGEATKKINPTLKDQNKHIPWKRISGLRDVLIHDYMAVDIFAVWEITQQNIPQLKEEINNLILKLEIY